MVFTTSIPFQWRCCNVLLVYLISLKTVIYEFLGFRDHALFFRSPAPIKVHSWYLFKLNWAHHQCLRLSDPQGVRLKCLQKPARWYDAWGQQDLAHNKLESTFSSWGRTVTIWSQLVVAAENAGLVWLHITHSFIRRQKFRFWCEISIFKILNF